MILTEENYSIYAAKHYVNEQCFDEEEFYDDLKRISHIKKLLLIYRKTGVIKVRLVLNHLITLYNVFYPGALTNLLLFRLEEYEESIVPFLKALNYLEQEEDYEEDEFIAQELQRNLR